MVVWSCLPISPIGSGPCCVRTWMTMWIKTSASIYTVVIALHMEHQRRLRSTRESRLIATWNYLVCRDHFRVLDQERDVLNRRRQGVRKLAICHISFGKSGLG